MTCHVQLQKCAAAFSLQVPNSCTELDQTLLYKHEVFFVKVSCSWRGTSPVNNCVTTAFFKEVLCGGLMRWDSSKVNTN